MNNVREVNRINEKELELAVEGGASWHDDYKDSAYIFVGNLDKRLTEGDVITIFSQYGEILDINLPRIPEGGLRDRNGDNTNQESGGSRPQQQQQQAGKPGDRRGFGFLLYEDQRSTVLAVDNLNGFVLLGRTIRVDHVKDYKMPGAKKREEEGELVGPSRNAAPALLDGSSTSGEEEDEDERDQLDLADPMAAYIAASKKDKKSKSGSASREDKEDRRRRKEDRKRKREEREKKRGDDSGSKKRRSEERGNRDRDVDKERKRERGARDARDASYDKERSRPRQGDYRRDDRQRDYASRDNARRDDGSRPHIGSIRDDYGERQGHNQR